MEIAILLATYNGENYLSEQLNSLEKQTEKNWKLYIRDDCSTDSTIAIISDFQRKHKDNVIILNSDNKNIGAKNSFIELLKFAEGTYYMFCDQDDVWLNDKIEKSLAEMIRIETKFRDQGILVFCDAVVTDENLNVISKSFWKTTLTNPYFLLKGKGFEVFNCAPGCTMFFNNHLKSALFPFPEKLPMHDWWLAIVAQRSGTISPLETPLILYRQHSSNAIGAKVINKNYFFEKFNHLSKTFKAQKLHLSFLEEIGGIGIWQFYWIKLNYNIRRFFS